MKRSPGRDFFDVAIRAAQLSSVAVNFAPDRVIPSPRRAPNALDCAVLARRLDCRNYSGCLDVAIAGSWRGFHCGGCNAYVAPTRDELVEDIGRLLALARAARLGD